MSENLTNSDFHLMLQNNLSFDEMNHLKTLNKQDRKDFLFRKRMNVPFILEDGWDTLNYKCMKCGVEYGVQPSYCHSCGSNHLEKIEPHGQGL